MPIQTWTPGQQLTAAELTAVTNMLPAPQVATANVASAVPGTLYRCQPTGGGSITITLPAPTLGNAIGMKLDSAAGSCVLAHNATEQIYGPGLLTSGSRGVTSVTLSVQDAMIVVLADGTNWHVEYQQPTANAVRARMYLAGAATISNNTLTLIPYDTTDYDPSGMITTGASAHFTAPVAGTYLIQGAWGGGTSVSAGRAFIDVVKNVLSGYVGTGGTRVVDLQAAAAQDVVVSGTTQLVLAANDTISFWGYQLTGGTVTFQAGSGPYECHASITFVSP